MEERLVELNEESTLYLKRGDEETRRANEFQKLIKKAERDIVRIKAEKRHLGGVNAIKLSNQHAKKRIRILENQADKLAVRSNEAEMFNQELIRKIDEDRVTVVGQKALSKALTEEYATIQQRMKEAFEMSNQFYNEKLNAEQAILELQQDNEQEMADFHTEINSLDAVVESERRMRNEIDALSNENAQHGELTIEEENRLREKLSKFKKDAKALKQGLISTDAKINSYEEAFKQLKEIAGIKGRNSPAVVAKIVKMYIDNEDENFSLFGYIQDINREIDKEQDLLLQIQEETEKYALEQKEQDSKRKKSLKELEARLERYKKQYKVNSERFDQRQRALTQICEGVQEVFEKLECEIVPSPKEGSGEEEKGGEGGKWKSMKKQSTKKSGTLKKVQTRKLSVASTQQLIRMSIAQGVDESNLMVCLGIIEQKACELVNEYKAVKLREKHRHHKAGMHGSGFGSSGNVLKSSNIDAMLSPSGPSHPRRRAPKPHVEVPGSLVGSVTDAKGFSYDEHEEDDDDDFVDSDGGSLEKPMFSKDLKEQFFAKASHGHGHGGHAHGGHGHGGHGHGSHGHGGHGHGGHGHGSHGHVGQQDRRRSTFGGTGAGH